MSTEYRFVRHFSELTIHDINLVGGKNASLGEMYSSLTAKNIKVPNGFATTADAYYHFIKENNLEDKINTTLSEIDTNNIDELQTAGAKIRQWIIRAKQPEILQQEIKQAYAELCNQYGPGSDVAIRSSATAEDLPNASFAGQPDTYLNIRGTQNLLITCKQVFASLFTNRAISYRVDQGFDHMNIALSIGVQKMVRSDKAASRAISYRVDQSFDHMNITLSIGVQKMVRSDKAASGVMFTIDTESGFKDVIFTTGAYGLGENIVQDKVIPDEFFVHKPTLKLGYKPVIKKHLGNKLVKMIYGTDAMAGSSTRDVNVNTVDRNRFCITDAEVIELARYALVIEEHYSDTHKKLTPMDIEWAKDGDDGQLYIVQARPETVESGKSKLAHTVYQLDQAGQLLLQGKSVGRKITNGRVRVILSTEQMHELKHYSGSANARAEIDFLELSVV